MNISLHNIAATYQQPDINFYNECKDDNKIFDVSIPNDGWDATFDKVFTNSYGADFLNAINSAVQSENYYFTLGIKCQGSMLNDPWFIGTQNSYDAVPEIELTISYTTENQVYEVYNKIDGDETYGQLVVDNNKTNPYDSGDEISFVLDSPHNIRTDELPFILDWDETSTQKHQYWQAGTQTPVHDLIFDFKANLNNVSKKLTANFDETKSVTITSVLEGTEGGEVEFNDPWYYFEYGGDWFHTNTYYPYESPKTFSNSTLSSYGGVFLNQNAQFSPDLPIYSVKTTSPQTIYVQDKNRQFYFQNWESSGATFQNANNLETPVVFNQTGATVKAVMKGTQLSSTSASFNKNNQNKMVQVDGKHYKVYESMNRIWLERSSDNGITWTLMNNGKPIDIMSGGKYPSISAVEYSGSVETFVIVYNLVAGDSELRMQLWSSGQKEFDISVQTNDIYDFVSSSTVPVVSFNCYGYNGYHNRNGKILVAWESDGYVLYQFGILADAVVTWNDEEPEYISSSSASNLTVSKYGIYTFHLAWQEGWSNIKYCKLGISGAGGNIVTISDQATISTGNGFPINYYPSITTSSSGYPIVAWVGSNYYNSSYTKIIRRMKSSTVWSSNFAQYGSNTPLYPQINMAGTAYVVAWTENNGAVKFIKPWGGVITFGTSGSYIQLANSTNVNSMYGSVLNTTSSPYPFTTTTSVGSTYKVNAASFNEGRGVVASIDTTQFFFIMGDVSCNGENIGFEELSDTLIINKKKELEDYLLTESFQFGNNDELALSLYLGVSDSVSANSIIGKNKKVNFSFELIEDGTNKVLGKYENFVHKKGAIIKDETKSYKISGEGIGHKSVRLRLVLDTNIDGTYTLLDVKDNQKVLAKSNASDAEVISYAGDLEISDYALLQNYPNPFNPSTTIKYQIPNDGMVSLRIYDITGQEVKTLVNQAQIKGRYEVNFDASNLSSGVYFYRLNAGNFTKSMKMIILK